MIRFNIIGTGFLDFEDGGSLGFKSQNPHFRFCDISLDRSVEFTVPATGRNRAMLGFGEDPNEYGEMLRKLHACQMVYDGGAALGTLAVTAYEGEAFKCVFYKGGSDWLDRLQDLKLSDCITTAKGIVWDGNGTAVDANLADPTDINVIMKYENGFHGYTPDWQLVPSVNVAEFIADIFTNLGVPFNSDLPHDYWMVSGSMKGGPVDNVTMVANNNNDAAVTQLEGYLSTVDDYVYASRNVFFGIYSVVTTSCRWYKAERNIKMTFDANYPQDVMMIGWVDGSTHPEYAAYGGRWYNEMLGGWLGEPLAERTIEVKKGSMFQFFKPDNYYEFGYTTVAPHNIQALVEENGDLELGELWRLQTNMPDMTVFEFLKSIALATGRELTVDPDTGVSLALGSYGQAGDFKALKDVVSVDHVSRNVAAWGDNTVDARIVFDDEDYVEQPVVSSYPIPSEIVSEEKDIKSGFSTGSVGTNGILIKDVTLTNGNYKFAAKKWTLAKVDPNSAWLQRIGQPAPVGYDDISANSTCLRVKVAADEAEFFALTPSATFLWRGAAFIWTDADWSAGVMGLTLQRVSDQASDIVTPTPEMVSVTATFTQGGATIYDTDSLDDLKQYLVVTAHYSDSSEAVVPSPDYVLSGSLVAPSSTITVSYGGFSDTFTVQVTHQSLVSDYVQNGLVLMLDGIEQGNEAGKWKDLVNGLVFTPTGGVTFEENCIALDGTGRLGNNSFVTPLSNDGTIELVFEKTSTSGMIFVPTGGSQKIAAGFFNSGFDWSIYGSKPRYPQINKGSVSVNNDRCLYDGIAQASNGNDYISSTTTTTSLIGCRYNGSYTYYFTGKIYCIRIYNRKLTEAEVLQNQEIDYKRFGIGYNP